MQYEIEPGDMVRYDDKLETFEAEVIDVFGDKALVRVTKGNKRHQRNSEETVELDYLFCMNKEENELELVDEY